MLNIYKLFIIIFGTFDTINTIIVASISIGNLSKSFNIVCFYPFVYPTEIIKYIIIPIKTILLIGMII